MTKINLLNIKKNIDETYYRNKNNTMGNLGKHYGGNDNPHEPIKIIEYYDLSFHLGNAIKYILRSGKKYPTKKGTIDDLNKAIWYLDRKVLLLGKKGKRKSGKGKK